MEINWNEAPAWADRVVRSNFSGEILFGDGVRVSKNGIKTKLAHNDIDLIEMRPDAWQEGEERMNNIAQNGNDGHYDEVVKQERYKKADGMDKIDEWARDKTHDQFRTIMWAMCEKYESRLGKKDAIVKEVGKMADYMHRWHLYEQQWDNE